MEQIFEFLIFSGKMAKCVQNFGHFANFVQYFGHISKKQKNMDPKHQILDQFPYYFYGELVRLPTLKAQ